MLLLCFSLSSKTVWSCCVVSCAASCVAQPPRSSKQNGSRLIRLSPYPTCSSHPKGRCHSFHLATIYYEASLTLIVLAFVFLSSKGCVLSFARTWLVLKVKIFVPEMYFLCHYSTLATQEQLLQDLGYNASSQPLTCFLTTSLRPLCVAVRYELDLRLFSRDIIRKALPTLMIVLERETRGWFLHFRERLIQELRLQKMPDEEIERVSESPKQLTFHTNLIKIYQ